MREGGKERRREKGNEGIRRRKREEGRNEGVPVQRKSWPRLFVSSLCRARPVDEVQEKTWKKGNPTIAMDCQPAVGLIPAGVVVQ